MNQLLEQTRQGILQKVDRRLVPAVEKVASAGKQVMYSEKSRDMAIEQLKSSQDPESIGAAAAKLAGVLFNQSRSTIPPEVLFPATMLLMIEALGFLEDAGAVQVSNDFLAECTQATGSAFLQMLGVTPEKLQGMMAQQQGGGAPPPAAPAPTGIVASAKGGV
jgi:hypothetical protein